LFCVSFGTVRDLRYSNEIEHFADGEQLQSQIAFREISIVAKCCN